MLRANYKSCRLRKSINIITLKVTIVGEYCSQYYNNINIDREIKLRTSIVRLQLKLGKSKRFKRLFFVFTIKGVFNQKFCNYHLVAY